MPNAKTSRKSSQKKPKVLISDKLSAAALQRFKERGIDADLKTDLSKEALAGILKNYDGLAVRSQTKVTAALLQKAPKLKIVGRAGIGIDNIDLDAASRQGVIVMNAPLGNSITTAEHAIAMMMALARKIPQADRSTQDGKWEKSRFMGMELAGKVLGIIGCGNIGSLVADRAAGLHMRVIAADPFLSAQHADELRVEKVELRELFKRADVISLHTPLTEKTRGIINAKNIALMRKGVLIVNCARGALVEEKDLKNALQKGQVAAAALDVFSEEPAKENMLFGMENVVCTPHLGASTTEAQEKVALQIAEQMADYLVSGAVSNALNMPSISMKDAQRIAPFITLAEQIGLFAGQLLEESLVKIEIEYAGSAVEEYKSALSAALLSGVLSPSLEGVNMVRAPSLARERGISVSEEVAAREGKAYENYIRLTVSSGKNQRSLAGTIFSDGKPRIIQSGGINMESEFAPYMIYTESRDRPGFLGGLGDVLGKAGVNVASFALGRDKPQGRAIALIAVDSPVSAPLLKKICGVKNVNHAYALSFAQIFARQRR